MCDDEVVVAQSCAMFGCGSVAGLEFDNDLGEFVCEGCRELAKRSQSEGFRVMLSDEERSIVAVIHKAFLDKKKDDESEGNSCWGPAAFVAFSAAAMDEAVGEEEVDTLEALASFWKEEFDIALSSPLGVALRDLEDMYGGFKYNNVDALDKHATSLEDAGLISLSFLE